MMDLVSGYDLLDQVSMFALVLMRAGGLVVFCPILGSEALPIRVRVMLALALTLVLLPLIPPELTPPSGALSWIITGIRELAVGFCLGLAAQVLFTGLEGAARLIAGQSGFALSSMVDPLTGAQSVTPALFQSLLATTLFLAANLHHLFIRGLVDSYSLLPPAAALPETSGLEAAVGLLGTRMFTVCVELAAPALVVTFAVDLVLVLVGRALPQVPILLVGYPVKMTAGLVAMVILTVATGSTIGWIGKTFARDGAALLAALGTA
jgi:flagellar biosynthetic protein FliR